MEQQTHHREQRFRILLCWILWLIRRLNIVTVPWAFIVGLSSGPADLWVSSTQTLSAGHTHSQDNLFPLLTGFFRFCLLLSCIFRNYRQYTGCKRRGQWNSRLTTPLYTTPGSRKECCSSSETVLHRCLYLQELKSIAQICGSGI